jgi:hypothetical protein
MDAFRTFHPKFHGHLKRTSDAAVYSSICLHNEKPSYLARLDQVISIKLQTGNSWSVDEYVKKH